MDKTEEIVIFTGASIYVTGTIVKHIFEEEIATVGYGTALIGLYIAGVGTIHLFARLIFC